MVVYIYWGVRKNKMNVLLVVTLVDDSLNLSSTTMMNKHSWKSLCRGQMYALFIHLLYLIVQNIIYYGIQLDTVRVTEDSIND